MPTSISAPSATVADEGTSSGEGGGSVLDALAVELSLAVEALLAGASSGVVSFLAEAVVVERVPDQRWSAVILGNLRLRVEIGDYTLWILGG